MSALQAIKDRLKEFDDLPNIDELDLSEIDIGKFTPEIKKELEKCKKVTILILQGCNLQSLENLPKWALNVIEVSENKLKDDVIPILASISSLHQISCAANQIKDVASLKPLADLKQLAEVDFSENPVAQAENYRSWLFGNIPSLEVVDNTDKDGNVVEEEEEFEDGSEDQEEEWDDDEDEQDYSAEEEESSEKPKKKKK